jgi:outer membrane receptor protein involved in Fe transport
MVFTRVRISALLFVTLILWQVSARGQATTGTISGRVVDPTGASVGGATVVISNIDNGIKTTAATNDDGEFTETALPPNNYQITIDKEGFSSATVEKFKLDIDQKARFNIKLRIGATSTNVEVTDSAPILQVQGGETGQVIGAREIEDLPILGRDFSGLMLLVPGVVSGGGGNNLNLSVNGQREFSNSVQINGVEVTGNRNNDTNVRPSPDAIEAFKVVTSSYAPEFGRASGGSVIIQTKAGTNNLHGSAFYFYRPTATAANQPFAPAGSTPFLQQHNYGATIGGTIKKDKAFFFLAYEGIRNRDESDYEGQTATVNQVSFLPNGDVDLSGLKDPTTGNEVPIYDPFFYAANFYAEQYPGNIIPAAEVSPAGKRIIQQLFPAAQNNNIYGNFNVVQKTTLDNNVANLRLDYTFSQNNRIYLTYDVEQGDTTAADPYAGKIPIPGGGSGDSGDLTGYENHVIGLTFDHVFSPTLLSESRVNYFLSTVIQHSPLDGSDLATQFGIQNANIPGFPDTYSFPQIQFQSGPTTGGSTYKPLTFRDENPGFVEAISWTHGRHNAKFGYEFRHLHSHPDFSLFPVPYEYIGGQGQAFTSDPTYSNPDYSAYYYNGGSEIADVLLGLPYVVDQGLALTKPDTSANEHSFYLQDYWQVTSRLNLTYGVRYEYQQPYVDANNGEANFDIATKLINLAGRGSNSRSLVDSNKKDFMPRLGLAYQVLPGTVIRAGYGIFYSPENDAREDILTKNYPFFTQQEFVNSYYTTNATSSTPQLPPFYYRLDTGIPRQTSVAIPAGASTFDITTVPFGNAQTLFSEPTHFPTAYSQNYNLTVEHQLNNATSFEIGYVGARTIHLSYEVGNYNVADHISAALGKIQTLLPVGLSNYNSLQAKLSRNFSHGYSILASYTWAHSFDNGPAPFDLGKGTNLPQNPFDIASEYSNSDGDVRHNFVMSQIIELPFGKGKRFLGGASGVVQTLFGGWQLNSITTLHTGIPINIVSDDSQQNTPGLRPNLVGDPNVSHRTKSEWFNTKAFVVPPMQAALNIPGDTPRNYIYGPGNTNEDVSLFKVLSLPREMKFQIRIEAFNVLNTPHYGNPINDFKSTQFGEITTGGGTRVMQFAGRLVF